MGRWQTVGWETPGRGTELGKDSLQTATVLAIGILPFLQPATVRRRVTTGTAATVPRIPLHPATRPIAGRPLRAIHPVADSAAVAVEQSTVAAEAVGVELITETKRPARWIKLLCLCVDDTEFVP